MKLIVELFPADLERLRRRSRSRSGGWSQLCGALVDAAVPRGSRFYAELRGPRVEQFVACCERPGRGGWQDSLRVLRATLVLDDGRVVTTWRDIVRHVMTKRPERSLFDGEGGSAWT